MAFLASIQFYQLFTITTNKNELLPINEATPSACPFCKILEKPELVVAGTNGNTCRSIQLLAAKEVNGSEVCAIIQKKERVCCPAPHKDKNSIWRKSVFSLDVDAGDDVDGKVCHGIKSLLDISQWPDIVFFEDHPDFVANHDHDFDRKENVLARKTVAEFNRIRKSVLTTSLLDEGITEGSLYASQSFAQRFMESGNNSRPLSIAVTGNSFTIGSNCGESTSQNTHECAWPNRLTQRWKEIVAKTFGNATNSEIEWRMLQENAQGSNNVMHLLQISLRRISFK